MKYSIDTNFKKLKEYEEIDDYYGEIDDIHLFLQEVFCDRVESQKYIVRANKEIERLKEQLELYKVAEKDHEDLMKEMRKISNNVDLKLEIERLNNILNELEKWLKELIDDNNNKYDLYKEDKIHYEYEISNIRYQNNMLVVFLDKIKELRGDNDGKD